MYPPVDRDVMYSMVYQPTRTELIIKTQNIDEHI